MAETTKPKAESASVFKGLKFTLPDDNGGMALYPAIYELLTPRWDGQVMTRQAGTLSVKADAGGWRVTISCPTEGLQTSLVCKSLETLLHEVDFAVTEGKCHWGLTWARQKKNQPTIETLIQ